MWQPPRDPRRRSERHRTDVVKCDLGDVVDISSTGVRVLCTCKPPIRRGQMVAMRLISSDGAIKVTGQAVWTKRKGLRKFELGFRFTDLKSGVGSAIESAAKFGFFRAASDSGSNTTSSRQRKSFRAAVNLPDYYKLLGVKPTASDDEIKAAYRSLARKHHPDISKSQESEQVFIQISEAYHVLSDPERRRSFDLQRAA
jgi:hypothetical protein